MKTVSLFLGVVIATLLASGCDKPIASNSSKTPASAAAAGHEGHDHSAQDHTAPHGGHLIELGRNHEYHAELVDDDKAGTVTIYMMDADMKPMIVKQPSVSLALSSADNTQTFELLASQPDGAAEFKGNDEKMMQLLDDKAVTGKLRVMIGDKAFSGVLEHHDHDHAEGTESDAGHEH